MQGLEKSFRDDHLRTLVPMTMGSGKTFTAVSQAYRLLRYGEGEADPLPGRPDQPRRAGLRRVPQLRHARRRPQVRRALQHPAPALEPASTRPPRSSSRRSSGSTRSCTGEEEFDEALEAESAFERDGGELEIEPAAGQLPAEAADRAVRLHLHRRVPPLDLRPLGPGPRLLRRVPGRADRDPVEVHLRLLPTATSSPTTRYEQSVIDGVNVDYTVYRIETEVTQARRDDRRGRVGPGPRPPDARAVASRSSTTS